MIDDIRHILRSHVDFLRHSLIALVGGSELRTLIPISIIQSIFPMIAHIFIPLAKSCSIQHPRLTSSDSLQERWKWLNPQYRSGHA
jgi:hypothetical protein